MARTPTTPSESPADKRKQREAAQEDVLMREVDEAVRQDELSNFMDNYGKPLLAAVVLGLAAFAGYLYWDSQREAAMEKESETLISARRTESGITRRSPLPFKSALPLACYSSPLHFLLLIVAAFPARWHVTRTRFRAPESPCAFKIALHTFLLLLLYDVFHVTVLVTEHNPALFGHAVLARSTRVNCAVHLLYQRMCILAVC